LDAGDVVPTPTFPPEVAKYAPPVAETTVVDAYGKVDALEVELAVKNAAVVEA
jgi:hypothetical protein